MPAGFHECQCPASLGSEAQFADPAQPVAAPALGGVATPTLGGNRRIPIWHHQNVVAPAPSSSGRSHRIQGSKGRRLGRRGKKQQGKGNGSRHSRTSTDPGKRFADRSAARSNPRANRRPNKPNTALKGSNGCGCAVNTRGNTGRLPLVEHA